MFTAAALGQRLVSTSKLRVLPDTSTAPRSALVPSNERVPSTLIALLDAFEASVLSVQPSAAPDSNVQLSGLHVLSGQLR
jgi:hypothetical protein